MPTVVSLVDFLRQHTLPIHVGETVDVPESWMPVYVGFFAVACNTKADSAEFVRLVKNQRHTHGGAIDLFDYKPHNYHELSMWIGDRDFALRTIALGGSIGVWRTVTPDTLGEFDWAESAVLAQVGVVAAIVVPESVQEKEREIAARRKTAVDEVKTDTLAEIKDRTKDLQDALEAAATIIERGEALLRAVNASTAGLEALRAHGGPEAAAEAERYGGATGADAATGGGPPEPAAEAPGQRQDASEPAGTGESTLQSLSGDRGDLAAADADTGKGNIPNAWKAGPWEEQCPAVNGGFQCLFRVDHVGMSERMRKNPFLNAHAAYDANGDVILWGHKDYSDDELAAPTEF